MKKAELRDALDHVWGVLPTEEVLALPADVREVCVRNHTFLWHRDAQDSPEGADTPSGR